MKAISKVSKVEGRGRDVQVEARSLLRSKLAGLSEAECAEVCEYIEVMRLLHREAADRELFGDGFARRVAGRCRGVRPAPPDTLN